MDIRSIDPSECWVRHVRRGAAGQVSAMPVARVYFVRTDAVSGEDGLNGRQGWQTGETTLVLSDDGSWTLTLPNVAGDDGVLHRRRFDILTNPNYEPGEEWLEFWSDADQARPGFVGTPTDYSKSKSTITLKGADLPVVLAGAISSDVDAWDGTAPADVLRHYTRLPVLAYGADLAVIQTGAAGAWGATAYSQALTDVAADCWTAAARLRWTTAKPTAAGASRVRLDAAGLSLQVDVFDGAALLQGAPERDATGKRQGLVVPGSVELRIITRYDRVFAFVAGELVADFRRLAPWPAVPSVAVNAYGGTITIDGLHVETPAAFAGRTSIIERRLPGIPPPTGLRGRYWNAAPVYGQYATREGRLSRLWPLAQEAEPAVDRVDPQLNFPAGTAQYPPNLNGAYAARWTGAIYLDLAATDRKLRLTGLVGNARLYVGRTLRAADEAATSWMAAPTATITTAALRAWIGESAAGWYPIVVEHAHETNAPGIVLEDTPVDAAGNPTGAGWATVPQARLSPIGCYEDLIRLTPHRTVLGDVAQAFGYQWRVEPASLESGLFPGQLTFQALVGRQTQVIIDDDAVGTDAEVQGAAGDVIDGLLADAAGIADSKGAGQLTAQVVDYQRASSHLALRQAYESLAEISEAPMLATRADSILTLRSSPNEQVGVRPRGQRDLVDTFPLTGVLARMDWRPGDGVRLALDSIDVIDTSPRQLTSITWPQRRDGLGPPIVGFRQRPRTVKAAMRRLAAAIYGARRNYQGSIAIVTGSPGGATSVGAAVPGAPDAYSRAPLPDSLDDIVRAVVVVRALTGTGWRLEVGGTDLGTTDGAVSLAGRYDITRAVKDTPGQQQVYCRLIGGTTGSYELSLEVHVRV